MINDGKKLLSNVETVWAIMVMMDILNITHSTEDEFRDGVSILQDKMKFYILFDKFYDYLHSDTCTFENTRYVYRGLENVLKIKQEYSDEQFVRRIFKLQSLLLNCSNNIEQYKSRQKGNEYHAYIVKNFKNIFEEYSFVAKERKTKNGRIDILAKDNATRRNVIIEIKTKEHGKAQLFSYASSFKNPILVHVCQHEITNKHPNIIYKTVPFIKD